MSRLDRGGTMAVTTFALALAAACAPTDSTTPPTNGQTRIKITDAPFPWDSAAQVNLHLVRIDASTSADTLDAQWTTVASPNRTVNLLDYQQGRSVDVGGADLGAASYRAVRIVIDTDRSGIIHKGGRDVPVEWYGSGVIAIHTLVEPAVDVPAAGANIVLDIDVGRSFKPLLGRDSTEIGHYEFRSWIRAVDEAKTGKLTGRVTCATPDGPKPVADATLFLFSGTAETGFTFRATGRTTADGFYTVAFLLGDTYDVSVEPLFDSACGPSRSHTTTVTAGSTTTLDIALAGK